MTFTLDIAALASAVAWPILLVVILLLYPKAIPNIARGLASRISKLEFAGISIELAIAKPFVPEWSGSATALDLRRKASSIQVTDSTAGTFLSQLAEEGTADYALVSLGVGKEWLTARLFIMSIVYARMKGIECFVFLETLGGIRKRFVGWAHPERVRWTLAKQYPWLEQAYAQAYSSITSQQQAVVVSRGGRLGYPWAPRDPNVSIEFLKAFLLAVQLGPPAPTIAAEQEQWVLVDAPTNTYEHARWVTSEDLEQILDDDLHTSSIRAADLSLKGASQQARLFLSQPGRFVAVVSDDQRFDYLVDRSVLLEQIARRESADPETKS